MNELIFNLSKTEFIKIITKSNIDFCKIDFCCSEIQAYFINEQELRIGQQSAGEFFEHFITRLKKVVHQKLKLHESLTQNLGFMQNEYYQDETGFFQVSTIHGSSSYWVGLDYNVWTTFDDADPMVTTWLYNDHESNIILEVTKNYPWVFLLDGLEYPNFITYDEFMKDYKPLIYRVIPQEVAIEWLNQAMKVYRAFFSSEEDYLRACKENNW